MEVARPDPQHRPARRQLEKGATHCGHARDVILNQCLRGPQRLPGPLRSTVFDGLSRMGEPMTRGYVCV